jgi:hypothetical protein
MSMENGTREKLPSLQRCENLEIGGGWVFPF